jgi:glycosyltransferase involved in cell wall biosynthesis
MKNDGLIVIGRLGYPSARAASNRVHLYCKALKEVKGFPLVINLHSVFTKPQTFNYLGRNDGIPFYYSQQSTLYENNLLKRNIKKIKGFVNALTIIKRLQKKHNLKVMFYSTSLADEVILFIFLKFWRISIITDCCEAPLFLIQNKKNIFFHKALLRLRIKMYDELIVISDYLFKYYSAIFPSNKIFKIPILVDMERFKNDNENVDNEKKIITYIGFMGGNKDGLENLIESMALVHQKCKKLQLELIGSASKEDLLRLKNKVDVLGLTNVVSFLGSKKAEEIPYYLSKSDLLVLARPDNNQAKAGFSTKLGEYLASGKPVVITITGEISKYLKDKESAYLVEPDNIEKFADKIILALEDVNAVKIGLEGKKIANQYFNYKLYGEKISEIIHDR